MKLFNNRVSLNSSSDVQIASDKGFSFVIAFFLITSVYLIPFATSFSFGEIIVFISILWMCVKYRKIKVYKNDLFVIFAIYAVICSFFMGIINNCHISDTTIRLLRDAFYWSVIFIFGYSFIDYDTFKKWIKTMCILLCLYIITQFLVFFLTGYLIPGFFLNATVAETSTASEIYQHIIEMAHWKGYLKANGFLTEGSHCGQALAIGMVIVFDFNNVENNTRKTFFTIGLFSLGSLLTFTATGFAFTFIIWIGIIFLLIKSGQANKKIGIPLLFIFVVILGYIFLRDSINIISVAERISSSMSSSTADNSSFLRVYKGFSIWGGLPLDNKIFGLGFGNYNNLSYLVKGISADYIASEYMNTISYILVSSGVFGFLLYILFCGKMFIQSNYNGKFMMVIIMIMSLSSSPYSSVFWVWMWLIVINNRRGVCYE